MSIAQSDCFRGTESGAIVKIFQRKQASFGALDRYFENKEYGVWGLGFQVWGLGFGIWGLGFRVSGLGFGV